jgi:putative phosphoesterase
MIKRIGVISDTHIKNINDDYALKLKEIVPVHFAGVDMILHAGDLVMPEVLDLLNETAETIAVRGNMDWAEIQTVLPLKRVVETGEFKIGLTHGYGPPNGLLERVRTQFDGTVDCIVFGHSHEPMCEVIDDVLFFNPGSPTDQVFVSHNFLGILELADRIRGKIIPV